MNKKIIIIVITVLVVFAVIGYVIINNNKGPLTDENEVKDILDNKESNNYEKTNCW